MIAPCTYVVTLIIAEVLRHRGAGSTPISIFSTNQYSVTLSIVRYIVRVQNSPLVAVVRIELVPFIIVHLVVYVISKGLF